MAPGRGDSELAGVADIRGVTDGTRAFTLALEATDPTRRSACDRCVARDGCPLEGGARVAADSAGPPGRRSRGRRRTLEAAVGLDADLQADAARPAQPSIHRSRTASPTQHRIRRLQRRVIRLNDRVVALEAALSIEPETQPLPLVARELDGRSTGIRVLRRIRRAVTRLERRIIAVDQAVAARGTPPPSPSPSVSA